MKEKEKKNSEQSRYADNFEKWARECVLIKDKISGREVPFVLNSAQRRVLDIIEGERRSGRPVRVIILKARQWGASTLVQVYMAWLQLVVRRGWNSLTCAHLKDASAGIRGMYSRLLRNYPETLKEGKPKDWELAPYEKSRDICYIAARDAQVAIATSLSPNSLRGTNFAMAHLSEVAFWADGDEARASEIVRTICGSIERCADSLVIVESTADGTGNYFHSEWLRAVEGKSDKIPIFVGWQDIDIYRREVDEDERETLLASLDDYEQSLLALGIDLERVAWYHDKRREYPTHEAMMAEFPTTPEEAFVTSGGGIIPHEIIPSKSSSSIDGREIIVVVAGKVGAIPTVVSRFAVAPGCMHCISDIEMEDTPDTMALKVAELTQRHDAECVVVDIPDEEEPGDARRISNLLDRKNVARVYDEEDSGLWKPDAAWIAEMTSILIELLRSGGVREHSDIPVEEYMNYRPARAASYRKIVARLVAARVVDLELPDIDWSSLLDPTPRL